MSAKTNSQAEALQAEIDLLRARIGAMRDTFVLIRDTLQDVPGVNVGNTKVHFAFHKAGSGLAL